MYLSVYRYIVKICLSVWLSKSRWQCYSCLSLLAFPKEFVFASSHNHVGQFLKILLALSSWRCLTGAMEERIWSQGPSVERYFCSLARAPSTDVLHLCVWHYMVAGFPHNIMDRNQMIHTRASLKRLSQQ